MFDTSLERLSQCAIHPKIVVFGDTQIRSKGAHTTKESEFTSSLSSSSSLPRSSSSSEIRAETTAG